MARWKKTKSSFDLAGHIFLPSPPTSLATKVINHSVTNGALQSKVNFLGFDQASQ
jgi:hypothetical protein